MEEVSAEHLLSPFCPFHDVLLHVKGCEVMLELHVKEKEMATFHLS